MPSGPAAPARLKFAPGFTALTRRVLEALRGSPDLAALLFLGALTIGCLLAGWVYRPSGAALPALPESPQITIHIPRAQSPRTLLIYSTLQSSGSQSEQRAELKISAFGSIFRPGQTSIDWKMDISGFTGNFCMPKSNQKNFRSFGGGDYQGEGNWHISTPGPLLFVRLCWDNNSPVAITEPYLSASLPQVLAPNETGTLIRRLLLRGTSLYDYAPNGGSAPTGIMPQTWTWADPLSDNAGSQASTAIPVLGSSIQAIQRDNHNAFISGILLGIGSGAFFSLVPILLVVVERRKATPEEASEESKDATDTESHPLCESPLPASAAEADESAPDELVSPSGSTATDNSPT